MNRSKLREIIIKVLYQKYIYDSKNLDYNCLKKEYLDKIIEVIEKNKTGKNQ